MTTESTTGTAATADTTSTTATTATTDSATATVPATGEATGDASSTATTATTEATTTTETTEVAGAPEVYADFTLPENYVLDGERLDTLKTFAKANNWTQAQAQEAVDQHIKLSEDGVKASREAMVTADEAEARTTFGDRFDAIATDAQAGIAHVSKQYPEAIQVFDDRGWGSNRVALHAFAEIGRLTRGDRMEGLDGSTTPDTKRDAATVLYGSTSKA